jgi:hypothetical protein
MLCCLFLAACLTRFLADAEFAKPISPYNKNFKKRGIFPLMM